VVLELVGDEGEVVTMDFAKPDLSVLVHACEVGSSGTVRMAVPSGECFRQ
jgi:hypothetical protein